MVLHEFGHWYDLKNKGNNVYEYAIRDKAASEEAYNMKTKLMQELYQINDISEVRARHIEWCDKYFSAPIEKRACDYADNVFSEMWNKIGHKFKLVPG